jgi:lipopolysaccharide biosynthesis protein
VELLEFPAGGFFWARPAALTPLHSLGLTLEALPPEPLAADNTLLHALVRLPC